MQTKEQAKNWKVVASVATVAALGVSGLAVASPGDPSMTPPPIEVEDTRITTGATVQTLPQPSFQVVPSPTIDLDDSLDTPLASADVDDMGDSAVESAQDSPDPAPAPAPTTADESADSPDDSPAPDPAPAPDDSPDDSADDSADSGDSPDS